MENNLNTEERKLYEDIRSIVEDLDCLVAFPHGNEHCILPEVYDELTMDIVNYIRNGRNK